MGKIVNRNVLSEIFGVSLPTVTAWMKAGMPVKKAGRKGQDYEFDTADVSKWLNEREAAAAKGDMSKSSKEEAERRYAAARARREELALARESNEVVPISEVSGVVATEFSRVKTRLLAIPTKLRPIVQESTPPEGVAAIIAHVDKMIYEALGEVVSYVEDCDKSDDEPGE